MRHAVFPLAFYPLGWSTAQVAPLFLRAFTSDRIRDGCVVIPFSGGVGSQQVRFYENPFPSPGEGEGLQHLFHHSIHTGVVRVQDQNRGLRRRGR